MHARIGVVVALSLVVVGVAGAAPAAKSVALTTVTLPVLHPGQTAWVSTLWKGGTSDTASFVLRATGPPGVTISYPANTGDHSSLYKQATLLADDTDYSALKVALGPGVIGDQTIQLALSYDDPQGKSGKVTAVTKALTVTLPVVAASGPAAQLMTTTVGPLRSGNAGFVEVSYKGVKPGLAGVAVTVVSKPASLGVSYPGDRPSSGLSRDSTLDVDETDTAAIRLDTKGLAPGSYPLGIDFAYGGGQHLAGSVTLVVS